MAAKPNHEYDLQPCKFPIKIGIWKGVLDPSNDMDEQQKQTEGTSFAPPQSAPHWKRENIDSRRFRNGEHDQTASDGKQEVKS